MITEPFLSAAGSRRSVLPHLPVFVGVTRLIPGPLGSSAQKPLLQSIPATTKTEVEPLLGQPCRTTFLPTRTNLALLSGNTVAEMRTAPTGSTSNSTSTM